MNQTAIHRMVAAAEAGELESVVGRMESGWAIMGEAQFLRGYCLLLPDPVVAHLNELENHHRQAFLHDMAKLGDAVMATTNAIRINYAMFGNLEPALHAHVFPRFDNEPEEYRAGSPWAYDWATGTKFELAVHGDLLQAIKARL